MAWLPLKAQDGREQFPSLCVSLRLPGTDTLGAKTGGGGAGREQVAEHTVVKTTEPGKLLTAGLSSSASGLVFTTTQITETTAKC